VCANGWSQIHQSCYQVIYNAVGRQGASDRCKSLGGYLAVVSEAQEMAAIQGYLISIGDTSYMYIDGSDAATEGVWVRESGDVMTYTGMNGVEPNGGSGENCLVVSTNVIGDYPCSNTVPAICEM